MRYCIFLKIFKENIFIQINNINKVENTSIKKPNETLPFKKDEVSPTQFNVNPTSPNFDRKPTKNIGVTKPEPFITKPNETQILTNDRINKSNLESIQLFINDEREWIKNEDIFSCSFTIGDLPSRCYVNLHQPLMRNLPEIDLMCDLRPPLAYIIIAKNENGHYSFVSSEMVNWEKLTIEQTLEKGEYHIFAKTYWNYNQPYNLIISTYSDSITDINPLYINRIPIDWLSQILSDMGRRSPNRDYPCKDEPGSYASNLMFDNNNFSGFCLFYYENASREGNMCINLNFKTLRGFKIMNLDHLLKLQGSEYTNDGGKANDDDYGSSNLVFKIPPSSSVVVIMQIIDLPWLCSVDWYHDIWFEYPVEVMINKMRRADSTDKIELDKAGLYLYEMEHERGVIILFENLSSVEYKTVFEITTIKNLVVKLSDDVKRSNMDRILEFTTKSKGITILNFGIIKSPKEIPYKLRYIYKFQLNK